jgi:hypothetical protein
MVLAVVEEARRLAEESSERRVGAGKIVDCLHDHMLKIGIYDHMFKRRGRRRIRPNA